MVYLRAPKQQLNNELLCVSVSDGCVLVNGVVAELFAPGTNGSPVVWHILPFCAPRVFALSAAKNVCWYPYIFFSSLLYS